MRTLRLPVGALLVALLLGAVLAVGASATPVAKTVATVACEGASATLLMHPGGGGKAIWDISVERAGRSQLPHQARRRDLLRRRRGGGTLDKSLGQKTGFGEPLICAFEVHKPGVDVYGTLHLVQLR